MKRGDIVVAAQRGEFTGKPRPFVIVQSGQTLAESLTVTVCPITTVILGEGQLRIALRLDDETGLIARSEVEVDRITTLRKSSISGVIGTVPEEKLRSIENGLKLWLDL